MEGYETVQHFQEVHLAVSEELTLPSFDAVLFEILLSDFGTIPKKSRHPMLTTVDHFLTIAVLKSKK